MVEEQLVRRQVVELAARELAGSRRLRRLGPEDRRAVEEVFLSLADELARCLVREAEREPALAAVLDDLYGARR